MADGSVIFDTNLNAEGFEKGLNNLAKGAAAAAAGVTATLGGLAAAALDVGMGFESSMSQVAATMGLSVEEIQAGSESFEILSNAAKEAGESTAFSASQAADGLNYLALAGYDAATAAEVLPSVLNLAAAGGMDLAYASDLATDAMAALGIEASAENLTTFGDKMAKTASKANTSVAQLGEAILTVGGTAKVLAGGTTELNTVLGLLANEGTKGSEAGTALRNVILSLTAPTDKAAAKMKKLGLNVADANGDLRPLNDIFKDLNASLDEMSSTEKTAALNEIFNKVDLKSVQTLLANCGQEFDNLSAAIDDSSGAMQQMADVQLDNLEGDLTILQSAAEGLGVSFYDNIKGTAREAVQSFTDTLTSADFRQSFDELSDAAGDMIQTLARLANDALPVLIDAFTFLATNLTTIIGLVGGAYAAFKTFTAVKKAADWVFKLAQNFGTAALQIGLYTTANGAAAVSQGVLNGVFSVFEVVVGVLTGKISLATAAQWAWNTAMSANPVGLVLAAVGALAAGIGIYALATRDSIGPNEEFTRSLEKSRDALEDLNQQIDDNVKARQESFDSVSDEAEVTRELAGQLFNLAEQEGMSAEKKAQMTLMVDRLNEKLPDLGLTIDAETGALNLNRDAVLANIDAQEKLSRVKAATEIREDVIKDRIKAERELRKAEQERAEAEKRLADVTAKIPPGLRNMGGAMAFAYAGSTALLNEEQELRKELDEHNAVLQEAQGKYDELGREAQYYSDIIAAELVPSQEQAGDAVADAAQNAKDAGEALEDASGTVRNSVVWVDEATGAIVSSLELSEDALKDYYDQLDGYTSMASNMFSRLEEDSAVSIQDMIANLEANQKAVIDWSENLRIAAERGINQGLLEQLRAAGPASAAQVRLLVDASDEELARLNEVFENSAKASAETFNNVMESAAFQETGKAAVDAFMGPFQEVPEDLSGYVWNGALAVGQAAEQMSGDMGAAGDAIQGATDKIGDGMTQAADTTADKAQAIGSSVEDAADTVGNAAGDIQKSAETVGKSSGTLLDGALGAFSLVADIFGGAKDGANTADSGIQTAASGIQESFAKVGEAAQAMHKGLNAEIAPLPGEFKDAAQKAVDNMNTELVNGQPVVVNSAQGVKDAAVNAVNALPDELYTVGVNAIQGLGNGMQSKSGWLASVAAGIVSKAVAAMKKEADIHSPSKRAAKEIGAPLVEGIGAGMEKQFPQLAGRMQSDISGMLARIRTIILADQAFHPAAQSANLQNAVYNDSHNTDMDIHVYYTSQGGRTKQEVAEISREIAAQAQWKMRARGVLI